MKKAIKIASITLFWLLLWEIIALCIDSTLIFPDPFTVFLRLIDLFVTSDFWISIFTSLFRVMLGILIAIVAGTVLAFIAAKVKFIYDILYPFMTILRATPVASFIILIVLFIGRETVPSIISLIMVLPVIFANIYTGISSIDKELKEVCSVYKMNLTTRLRVLYFPSVLPYFSSAVLSSIGLGWKAGIAAEILYPPLKSIGRAILRSNQLLMTEDLFAWTFVVIGLSLIFEFLAKAIISLASRKRTGGNNDN